MDIKSDPPLFSFTNCVFIILHDPHFAFNINLLFLDLTYVGSMSCVFFFFYTINSIHYIKYLIYKFSCWSFEIAPSFKSSSYITSSLLFTILLSFPGLIEPIINSKRLKRSSGSLWKVGMHPPLIIVLNFLLLFLFSRPDKSVNALNKTFDK